MRTKLRVLDLLTITAVFAVIVSLVVPAIGAARERARRTRCERNLSALGLAMLSYHDAHKVFPPGSVIGATAPAIYGERISEFIARSARCDNPGAAQTSAFTLLLPFIGEQPTFQAYNQSLASCAVQNATAVSTRIHAYMCPTNDYERARRWGYYEAPLGLDASGPALTDYALSMGGVGVLTEDLHCWWRCGAVRCPGVHRRAAGPFNINIGLPIDHIKDGTSHTLLMGESYSGAPAGLRLDWRLPQGNEPIVGESSVIVETPWSQGYLGSDPLAVAGQPLKNFGGFGSVFAATAWNAFYDTNGNLTPREKWFAIPPNESNGERARATFYRDTLPAVNHMRVDGTGIPGSLGSVQGFRSLHDTVPMLFADGSVRQIKPTIDPWLWVALSSCLGREPLPDGF